MIDMWIIQMTWWQAILAVIVGVVGAARLTRVVTYDDFPPAMWWRIKWAEITHDGPWAKLFTCSWCLAWYIVLVMMGTFLLTFVWVWAAWLWWIFWGSLAMAYLASMWVYWDEGKPD
jgi:hypothetical protein